MASPLSVYSQPPATAASRGWRRQVANAGVTASKLGERVAQRAGRGRCDLRRCEDQAQALDRAWHLVEPLRLEPEQPHAGGRQLLEFAVGVAVVPDDDEVGPQREDRLDVE